MNDGGSPCLRERFWMKNGAAGARLTNRLVFVTNFVSEFRVFFLLFLVGVPVAVLRNVLENSESYPNNAILDKRRKRMIFLHRTERSWPVVRRSEIAFG